MDKPRKEKIPRASCVLIIVCVTLMHFPAHVFAGKRCGDDCSRCHKLGERARRKSSSSSVRRAEVASAKSLFAVSAKSSVLSSLFAPTTNPHEKKSSNARLATLSTNYGSNAETSVSESSTEQCLSCHDGRKARSVYSGPSTPKVMNSNSDLAGGDFAYETAMDASGKGHSLGSTATAPGGTWANRTTGLSCTDCHDLDSKNYRYLKERVNGVSVKVAGIGDDDWERTSSPTDHNLYISGMDKFCGACHQKFYGEHNTRGTGAHFIRHPNKGGIPRKSVLIGSYDPLYPVEDFNANSMGYRVNASSSKVFCLSCHRAHASPYLDATRWDNTKASGKDRGCNACHAK